MNDQIVLARGGMFRSIFMGDRSTDRQVKSGDDMNINMSLSQSVSIADAAFSDDPLNSSIEVEELGGKSEKLSPLIVFLNSSLNVELVYIILKSITSFGVVDYSPESMLSLDQIKKFSIDDKTGDGHLKLDKIKIKNYQQWSRAKETQEFIDDKADVIEIKDSVKVIYYRIREFHQTFKEFFNSNDALKASLKPSLNFDQVFKAGAGAGRSGSFFFFSHDKRFIIKTMTKHELNLFLGMFEDYCKHFKDNPNSLMTKILGVFTVKSGRMSDVHIMLMENTLKF